MDIAYCCTAPECKKVIENVGRENIIVAIINPVDLGKDSLVLESDFLKICIFVNEKNETELEKKKKIKDIVEILFFIGIIGRGKGFEKYSEKEKAVLKEKYIQEILGIKEEEIWV